MQSGFWVGVLLAAGVVACDGSGGDERNPGPDCTSNCSGSGSGGTVASAGGAGGVSPTGGTSSGGTAGSGGGAGADISWPTTWEGPLVISQGGTISGRNLRSQSTETPVISIDTSEPVVIENCFLQSEAGARLITNNPGQPHIDVTIRNNYARALDPGGDGLSVGRFVIVQFVKNLVIEHNYFENTGGIYVLGPEPGAQSIKIRYNDCKNLNGYVTDGNGSYRCPGGTFSDLDSVCDNSFAAGGHVPANFVQFDKVQNAADVEIAWNRIVNEPYQSLVEDVFSFGNSSGTPSSPIVVHDNFVKGAYAIHPKVDSYTGGGVSMGDGGSAYITAFENHVVKTQNYGLAVFSDGSGASHDLEQRNSRAISSGKLDDGTPMRCSSNGLQMANGPNDSAHDLLIGWAYGDGSLHDWDLAAVEACGSLCWNIKSFQGSGPNGAPSLADEAAEAALWLSKLDASGAHVGP
jgi:hypothetical protein